MRVRTALEQRLREALAPEALEIEDQSALHAGHAGARPEGESHFRVVVVASRFDGRNRVARQRMVFEAAGDLLRTDIHALSITALTPAEAAARGGGG
ncbi:BolA family protein [Marinimicrococcus flavescens]|uniref:BolA family transcriptional regulator n=1 Tax=Marinimicrococcus flavescens TaxID=3031815 RepID=A0AAP3UYM2_9PROT|nr:BolA family transcriptional regulator [Marinimicrococcus flavescens]